MQISKWHRDASCMEGDSDAPSPESPEAMADRFGVGFSLLMLCVALVTMAMGLMSQPSFEKCIALESQSERNICYDKLRDHLLRPPAKGGNAPALDRSN
jgi:hypothetical protein